MDQIEVKGLRIAYEQAGEGPPLVLLHGGFGISSVMWRRQLAGLSDEFTVVAWDAPGCGRSTDPPEGFGASDYADCLAAFIDALGLGRPHVLGLSFGGVLALELYRWHPKVPRALELASAYAGWVGSLPAEVVEQRYDPPSYRSVMMAFRECVRRHQRLPQECFVDRGPELGSVYFETLLTRHFVTKKDRPASQPRMGSVIERLFGTTMTQLLHQLLGNTQASRHPRLLTREVDPRRLAVWTLSRFSARLCQYAYEVYDQMDHPALLQSPREAFAQGMQLAGLRTHRLIPYSEEFLLLTCPTTRTGYAKVDRARGMVVNGLRYWNPLMRSSQDAGKSVPVRYEPFDMSRAYAFLDGQWLPCTADAFFQVQGRSEREWQLILDEWREQQRQHSRKRVTVNGPLLAQFLEEVATEEQLLLQQQRDLEGVPIREAIVGQQPRVLKEVSAEAEVGDEELDLAALPQ